jgi:hypothetical protein
MVVGSIDEVGFGGLVRSKGLRTWRLEAVGSDAQFDFCSHQITRYRVQPSGVEIGIGSTGRAKSGKKGASWKRPIYSQKPINSNVRMKITKRPNRTNLPTLAKFYWEKKQIAMHCGRGSMARCGFHTFDEYNQGTAVSA